MRVSTYFRCLGKPGTHAFATHDRRNARYSAPHCRECKAKRGGRCIGRTAGGLHSRLHAVCDGNGRWARIALTEGQHSDDDGARVLLADHPGAKQLLADKGIDADWFGATLAKRRISACILAGAKRSHPAIHDVRLHKQRHKSENMFGRMKEGRRVAVRYDRYAHTVFSAICMAATGIFLALSNVS